MQTVQIQKTKHARSPRLETIQMVESLIKRYDGEFTKYQLWKHLPKKVMYQTFCTILNYLLKSYKISIDAEGKIGYLEENPRLVRYYLSREDLTWKKPQVIKDKVRKKKK